MIIKPVLFGMAVILGWVAVLAGVMVLSDQAPAALVMFPDAAFMEALPDGIAITGQNAFSVTLTSDIPGMARALYSVGAPLVLPAGLIGCAPLTS
jgi:hypothetical protein